MIKIDKNIPIPPRPRGAIRKYPWDEMQVGDSFFLPAEKRRTLSSAAGSAARREGRKYSVRSVTENGVEGVRCWRLT